MRLESNQQSREAEDLQSSGVTSFPTHPKIGPLVWNRTIVSRLSVVCSTIELQGELTWYQRLDSNQPHLVLQTSALPDELRWHIWRKAEESNPIPVKRTQFSRLVAGPSQLHYFPLFGALGET